MTIPTKEDFEDFRVNHTWRPNYELIESISGHGDLTIKQIENVLLKFETIKKQYFDKIEPLPVTKFFLNQSAYRLYRQKVTNEKRNKKIRDDWAKLTEKEQLKSNVEYFQQRQYRLRRLLRDDPINLRREIIVAFESYYYSDKWLNVLSAQKKAFDIFDEAAKLADSLEDLKCLKDFYHDPFFLGEMMSRQLKSLKNYSDKQNWLFPFTRQDNYFKERGLVYDLHVAHRSVYRASKAEAISLLMGTEGINYTFDTRTIERLIQGWREGRKQQFEIHRKRREQKRQ